MPRKYLGIDIQEGVLSAVLLQSGMKSRMVEALAQIPLATGEEGALNAGLTSLIEQLHPEGHPTILSIPTDHVTCRNMQMPFTDTKKIRQALPFELEPRLAFPVENLIIDFQKLESTGHGTRLMALAAEGEALKSILAAAADHHMDPEALVPGAYATGWWLCQRQDMPEDWILLDPAPSRCGFLLVHRRKVCLMRSFPVAPSGADAAGIIRGQLQQTLAGMDGIIQGEFRPARMMVSGSPDGREALLARLTEQLGTEIEPIDLFEKEDLTPASAPQGGTTAGLNNALACALMAAGGHPGALNFRQGPLSPKSRLLEYKPLLFRAGAFLAAALLLALVNLLVDISSLERMATDTKARINRLFNSALPDVHTIVDPVHQLTIAMDDLKHKALAAAGNGSPLPAIDLLNDLSKGIPGALDVQLTNLVAGDQSVLITGTTDSFNAVNEMKDHLEKNKLFKTVKINSANMDHNGKRIRFKIKIQL
jgi:general secretion pathway protein L